MKMVEAAENLSLTEEDLANIIAGYNQATERLQESHNVLQREVRRLRKELENKNRQLERRKRLAALGEMAAGLAHEIRNPLGGIQLYANLLRRDLENQPELQQIADKIACGVKALDRIVSDVLALTHTVKPKFKSADLVQLINSAIELLTPTIEQNKTQVSIRTPVSIKIVCDRSMLQQAFLNIIRNAIEASGTDGQVLIDIEQKSNFVIVQISDSGSGVPDEVMDRIFNPFFTTKDTGTGLGLSIVHRIVEAHGGSITCGRSDLTSGAVFSIKLPVEQKMFLERSLVDDQNSSR